MQERRCAVQSGNHGRLSFVHARAYRTFHCGKGVLWSGLRGRNLKTERTVTGALDGCRNWGCRG